MSRVLAIGGNALSGFTTALTARGNRVSTVAPAAFRLMEAREFGPEVILLDLETNGATVPIRAALLRDPELAQVPLVAIGESEAEARALGASAYASRAADEDAIARLVGLLAAARFPIPI